MENLVQISGGTLRELDSGSLRDSVVQTLKGFIKKNRTSGYSALLKKINRFESLKNDEEITSLVNTIENNLALKKKQAEEDRIKKAWEKELGYIKRHIERYLSGTENTVLSERLDNLLVDIAAMSDDEIKYYFPEVNFYDLRKVASYISYSQSPEGEREAQENEKRKEEIINRTESIIFGAFIENGILTDEDFNKYFSETPYVLRFTRKRAEYSWNMFKELQKKGTKELIKRRMNLQYDLDAYYTYLNLIDRGIMVDFFKLCKKTPDELIDIEEYTGNKSAYSLNRKNRKKFEHDDIFLDDYSTKEFLSDDFGRYKRTYTSIVQFEKELTMIDSILETRR